MSSKGILKSSSINLPTTPGRQVKHLKAEVEKKDAQNEALKKNINDLTQALNSLNIVTQKASSLDNPFSKSDAIAATGGKKKKKDADAPVPAVTAYRYFCEDTIPTDAELSVEKKRQMWKECQGDARKKYTDLAAEDKKRFDKENSVYQEKVAAKEAEEKALNMYYEKEKQKIAMEFFEAHLQAKTVLDEKKKKKAKDPDAPKGFMSSYLFYSQDKREEITKANPGLSLTNIAKILGEEWNKLSKAEQAPYEDLAAKDRLRYNEEKAAYDAVKAEEKQKVDEEREEQLKKDKDEAMKMAEEMQKEKEAEMAEAAAKAEEASKEVDSKTTKTKKKKEKKTGPKKPSSAYIFFCTENRAKIKDGMDSKATQAELMAEMGRQWKKLSDRQKAKYVKMSTKDKERYQKEMEAMEATK